MTKIKPVNQSNLNVAVCTLYFGTAVTPYIRLLCRAVTVKPADDSNRGHEKVCLSGYYLKVSEWSRWISLPVMPVDPYFGILKLLCFSAPRPMRRGRCLCWLPYRLGDGQPSAGPVLAAADPFFSGGHFGGSPAVIRSPEEDFQVTDLGPLAAAVEVLSPVNSCRRTYRKHSSSGS